MAIQPPAAPSPRNGNGNGRESLQLSLGGRSIGLQVRDLLSVLLLVAGCVGGYLIYTSIDHRLEAILAGQERVKVIMDANKTIIIEALHEQQTFIIEQVHQGQHRQDMQIELMRRLLLILELPPEILGDTKPLRPRGP